MMSEITHQEQELFDTLKSQDFDTAQPGAGNELERFRQLAESHARIENAVAVLSDLCRNKSYIYSHGFGQNIGLKDGESVVGSMFEEEIFSCIPQEELIGRHVLELRYTLFQQHQPIEERAHYNTVSHLHFHTTNGRLIPILHRTYVASSLPNGSIWLTLCIYSPYIEPGAALASGRVINNHTGETVPMEQIIPWEKSLLSERETDVLRLLTQGYSSKQIAETLYISVYTVYRHRQNILSALNVKNTAEAVQIGISLGLV